MNESHETSVLATGLALRPRQWASIAVLCLLALFVLGAAMWLGSGSDDLEGLPAALETDEATDGEDADDDAPEPEPDAVEELPTVTYEIYLARDPFEPVRTPPVEDTTDDNDTIVVDPDDPTDPDDPEAPTDPTDPSDPSDPDAPRPPEEERCVGDEAEAVCDGQVVSLLDLTTETGEDMAVIQVDTTVYEVRAREVFAERFQLLSIDRAAGSVEYLFGDSRHRLRLGERTLK